MFNDKLNISLLDLNHTTTGLHTSTMPLGIGILASYLYAKLPANSIDISLYKFTDDLCTDFDRKVDVIGFSMYSWNTRLNLHFAKQLKYLNPNAIVVCGGPNITYTGNWIADFLRVNSFVDYLVPFNGEVPFLKIVRNRLTDGDANALIEGAYYFSKDRDGLVFHECEEKLSSLSEVPSPYLLGIMDKFFPTRDTVHKLSPLIETNRGCPYTCTFCHTSHKIYNRPTYQDIDVIRAEIELFSERMREYPDLPLYIADNNFGMFNRDKEIADIVRHCQDTYGWPQTIDTTVGKSRIENILAVTRKMRPGTLSVTMSTQSMTPEVLANIKRKNLPQKDFIYFQNELSKLTEVTSDSRRSFSSSELIIGLPGETRESFFAAVRKIISLGIDSVIPYTLMVLKGTPLGNQIYERKGDYCLKYRIVPKQFGRYSEQLVIDTEEVAVATPTMTFDDYLECRRLSFVLWIVYRNDIFRPLIQMMRSCSFDVFDWLLRIISAIQAEAGKVEGIFDLFLRETESELWDSEEAITEFFQDESNYKALLEGRYGENLLSKYAFVLRMDAFDELIDVVFRVTSDAFSIAQNGAVISYLDEYREYCRKVKRISHLFEDDFAFEPFSLTLRYDFERVGDLSDLLVKEEVVTFYFPETTRAIVRNLKSGPNWRFKLQKFLRSQSRMRDLYPRKRGSL